MKIHKLTLAVALVSLACAGCSGKKKKKSGTDQENVDPDHRKRAIEKPPGPDSSMQIAVDDKTPDLPAPLSLTAADGTGLALTRLEAKVVVDGPISFTELHLSFRNPRSRVIEGRFAITLPQQATISRLAMQIGARWQEAEVVERQAARRAYEDFLHRKQDPALLEKEAGNEFRARIFPIPANGEKNLIVSYSQPLIGADATYRLPLRGLPRVQHLKVHALVGTGAADAATGPLMSYQTSTMEERDYVPNKDFEVAVPSKISGLRTQGLAGGDVVAARVRPKLAVADEKLAGLIILFDTSASRALGYSRQVERLSQLVRELAARHGAAAPLVVAAYDQKVATVYDGTLGGFGKPALDALRERRALGASDLHGALTFAAGHKSIRRALVITDGIATAGPTDGAALRELVTSFKPKLDRLDMVLTGGIRDPQMAARLVRGTLGHDGVALDGDLPVEVLARRVSQTTVSGIQVQIAGAMWAWPRTLDGVQPGDEFLVFARINQGALDGGKGLGVGLTGGLTQALEVPLTPVAQPLLVRATINAEIARLAAMRDEIPASAKDASAQRDKLKNEIIALSTRYRVLSDYTALLVLETERDYARFGIERTALADILTVGERGIELFHREQPYVAVAKPEPPPPPRRPRPSPKKKKRSSRSRSSVAMKTSEAPADFAPMAEKGEADFDGFGEGKKDSAAMDMDMEEAEPEMARAPSPDDIPGAGATTGDASGRVGGTEGRGESLNGRIGNARPRRSRTASAATRPVTINDELMNNPLADPEPSADMPARRMVTPERRPPPPPPPPPHGQGQPTPSNNSDPNSPFLDSTGLLSAPPPMPAGPAALTGKLADVMRSIEMGQVDAALQTAQAWRSEQPGDLMALIALGESLEASGQPGQAARAYGSIIDLFPSRADMRRFAGERLERLHQHGIALAADSYAKSVKQRPDHLTGHRLLAMALVRLGRYEQAFAAAEAGLQRNYPSGRFRGGLRILREDLGLIAAAWLRAQPKQRGAITTALKRAGATLDKKKSLRFVLTWETDANDVDFHIHDGKGGHAYYASQNLPSGGNLYADVTTGYGPECFTIPGEPKAFPYSLRLHYYSRGPMGFGMGKLEVLEHDGKGKLTFEQRPFIVMNDGAYVDVGQILPAKK